MGGTSNSTSSPSATRFDLAFATVDAIEAGFVNDPVDKGGATNHGVSLRFLLGEGTIDANRDGFADYDLDMDGDIDVADIKRLTSADAKALFKRCFWDRCGCDNLPAPLGEAVFDQAVNGGVTSALRLLQRAINRVDPGQKLAEDGKAGALTMVALRYVLALRGLGMPAVIAAYRVAAADRYRAIVASDPRQARFLKGWLRRAGGLGMGHAA